MCNVFYRFNPNYSDIYTNVDLPQLWVLLPLTELLYIGHYVGSPLISCIFKMRTFFNPFREIIWYIKISQEVTRFYNFTFKRDEHEKIT